MIKNKKEKKELLEESQIRRFMTLAKLPAINKIGRLSETVMNEEEECEKEEKEEVKKESLQLEEKPEELAPPSPELGGEEVEEPEMGGDEEGKEGLVAKLVDAIADAIEAATGVEIEVEGGAGEGEEEVELPGGEEERGEEPKIPAPGEEEKIEEESAVMEEEKSLVPTKPEKIKGKDEELKPAKKVADSLVNEVTKRVLARILKETKKSK
jgi:hypothetical protein